MYLFKHVASFVCLYLFIFPFRWLCLCGGGGGDSCGPCGHSACHLQEEKKRRKKHMRPKIVGISVSYINLSIGVSLCLFVSLCVSLYLSCSLSLAYLHSKGRPVRARPRPRWRPSSAAVTVSSCVCHWSGRETFHVRSPTQSTRWYDADPPEEQEKRRMSIYVSVSLTLCVFVLSSLSP